MKEIILDVLKKMRTDYGNNENIIFAQDSDLEVVVDELLTAINYTRCCESDSEQLFDFLEWFDNYCTVDVKPNKEDVELYLSK
jgi:hypothetical protein